MDLKIPVRDRAKLRRRRQDGIFPGRRGASDESIVGGVDRPRDMERRVLQKSGGMEVFYEIIVGSLGSEGTGGYREAGRRV